MYRRCKNKGKKGVAVVTNEETSWVVSKALFHQHGFKKLDEAFSNFELYVLSFEDTNLLPYFPTNWSERSEKFNHLTVLRSFQCPYVDVATENIVAAADKIGLTAEIIDYKSKDEIMQLSPTPYGIYAVVFKGQLLTFHRLTVHSALKRLQTLL